jgi:hypothetical protein
MSAVPDLELDAGVLRVIKRPLPVEVVFAGDEGVLQTLEGPVGYRRGDAILTGIQGERWPVRRSTFETRFQPTNGQTMGEAGAYVKLPLVALAKRLEQPLTVPMPSGGQLMGKIGDWLLQYAPGDYGVVADEIFRASYVTES